MGQEIKKLWEELKPINKTIKAKREGGSEKINGFKEKLDRTMKFWPRDAIERIQNEEDKFLQSMMGDGTTTFGPVDDVLATTEKKVLRRRHSEEEQRKKEANSVVDMTASSEEEEEETASQKRPVEDQVERFLQFIMCEYLPWWLAAPMASGEPANDLDLINKLIRYCEVDHAMAKKVMHKLKSYLCYLVEEMVPLSLFSSTVSENMKDRIVKKMHSYPETDVVLKRNGTGYGKPINPLCLTQLTNTK